MKTPQEIHEREPDGAISELQHGSSVLPLREPRQRPAKMKRLTIWNLMV